MKPRRERTRTRTKNKRGNDRGPDSRGHSLVKGGASKGKGARGQTRAGAAAWARVRSAFAGGHPGFTAVVSAGAGSLHHGHIDTMCPLRVLPDAQKPKPKVFISVYSSVGRARGCAHWPCHFSHGLGSPTHAPCVQTEPTGRSKNFAVQNKSVCFVVSCLGRSSLKR